MQCQGQNMDISCMIFDISMQFNQYQYCITGLMYHDMVIYRYIVSSLGPSVCTYVNITHILWTKIVQNQKTY